MTPAELRAEILDGPLAAELAPAWAAGDNTGVAAVLGRADLPGYVPPGPLAKYLADVGLVAVFDLVRTHLLLPPADPMEPPAAPAPFALFALASRLQYALEHGLRASVAEIGAGCDALAAVGLITAGQKAAVLALEVKVSRAQAVWGLDAAVSSDGVAAARKAGG